MSLFVCLSCLTHQQEEAAPAHIILCPSGAQELPYSEYYITVKEVCEK